MDKSLSFFRVVDIVEWRMIQEWHHQVTYQVEEQRHKCPPVPQRQVNQDVCTSLM